MRRSFFKDFSWYLIGSAIPMFIGIIKTPIFTRHFNTSDFGYLGLVTITFTFLSMFLFSGISSCVWRFYANYNNTNKLKTLYSNLAFLTIIAFIFLFIVSSIWYYAEDHQLIKQLIAFSFFHLLLNQIYLFYITIVKLEGKSSFYTVFQSIRAIVGLMMVLMLVFMFKINITSLISGLILVDFLAILILIYKNPSRVSFSLKLVDKQQLKKLIEYGSVGLLLNFCFITISLSDRYVISWFGTINDIGIYDQVYKIGQFSIMALVTVFFNTISPVLLDTLEKKDDSSKYLIRNYLKVLMLFGLPIIIYLSIFSKEIADFLLGKDFRAGYNIIPLVFMAMFLNGISNFYELRLKFKNKLKQLGFTVFFVTFLNLVLTVLFVSNFGYKWAAVTTLFTYIVMIVVFWFLDKEIMPISKKNSTFVASITAVLSSQFAIYHWVVRNFETSIPYKLLILSVFISSYVFIFKSQFFKLKYPVNY